MTPQSNISPKNLRKSRERLRLLAYRRQSHIAKAQHDIKITIQKQQRDNFGKLREAFKLIGEYDGPFLQNPELKKQGCLFLREEGLGPDFIDTFDAVGKWEWLEHQLWRRRFFAFTRARNASSRHRRVTA